MQEKSQRESRVAEARKQLAEAEARLQEAKVIQDEDRQNLAAGKRRIHPDYFERVKQAEADVEAARKALREARGY
jgi:cellobiose-specific phosphotransferase system component IIA